MSGWVGAQSLPQTNLQGNLYNFCNLAKTFLFFNACQPELSRGVLNRGKRQGAPRRMGIMTNGYHRQPTTTEGKKKIQEFLCLCLFLPFLMWAPHARKQIWEINNRWKKKRKAPICCPHEPNVATARKGCRKWFLFFFWKERKNKRSGSAGEKKLAPPSINRLVVNLPNFFYFLLRIFLSFPVVNFWIFSFLLDRKCLCKTWKRRRRRRRRRKDK